MLVLQRALRVSSTPVLISEMQPPQMFAKTEHKSPIPISGLLPNKKKICGT
jgi:hypothetical protein